MNNLTIIALLFSLALISSNTWSCTAIPQKISNIISQEADAILVGEMHGTNESPEYFYNLICNATELTARKITIAIELIDGDINLNGNNEKLNEGIHKSYIWTKQHDGKTSVAMFKLLTKLNKLIDNNKISVIFFDKDDEQRDLAMAMNLKENIASDTLLIALTGNRHNKIKHGNSWDPDSKNMGAYLKDMGVNLSSINLLTNGGSAWVCMPNCTHHKLNELNLDKYEEVFDASEKSGYQYHWIIGTVTASEPEIFSRSPL